MRIFLFLVLANFCFAQKVIYVGGLGSSDSNTGSSTQPMASIQKAASVAVAGDVVSIRSGVYRETIVVANSGITFQPDAGSIVIISGLDQAGDAGWSIHSGNIYKKTITLPVNGFNTSTTRIENNTSIYANQIFKDGEMMFEARWPKINTFADLLDRGKLRQRSSMVAWEPTYLQDNGLPIAAPGLTGATLVSNGWFMTEARTITSHSGNQLNHGSIWDNTTNGKWSRQRYYLTGKLALLTQEKEWHYENGTLYFWQAGGGAPIGVEYKARNWGFDIRGKSNIRIIGLTFKGCDPVIGNTSSLSTVIDNIKASYMNHHVRHDVQEWQGVGMSKIFGIKLIGSGSVIKNSELSFSGSSGVWLGANCRAENNLMHDMGYVGLWANPISLWERDGGQIITKNTIYRTGRSCVDFGYYFDGQHLNVEVSYNDFSKWGLISQDVGATYAWGQNNLTGLNYHHNWIHDTGAPDGPDCGANVAIYFDQASGPGTVHHNVTWNCGAADVYHEVVNETRTSGSQINFYNNTFANSGGTYPRSYITYRSTPYDVQRNNIYVSKIVVGTGSTGDIQASILPGTNPLFVGTGQGGLQYRVNSTSPAINKGTIINGITSGAINSPDIGAYEYGGEDWMAGYTPIPIVVTPPPTPTVYTIKPYKKNGKYLVDLSSDIKGPLTEVVVDSSNFWKPTASLPPPIDDTTKIDTQNVLAITTGWGNAPTTAIGWYKNTMALSNQTGSTATFKFKGTQIQLWGEKKSTHGTGTITVKQGGTVIHTEIIDFRTTSSTVLPALIYSSPTLQTGMDYTLELKVNTGWNLIDFFVVKNYSVSTGTVEPPPIELPPIENLINVSPTQNVKQIIETASNCTINFLAGTYNLAYTYVPPTVNLMATPGTVRIKGTQASDSNDQGATLILKGNSNAAGQFIKGLIIDGNNISNAGLFIERDNIVLDVNLENHKFFGVWVNNSANVSGKLILKDNSWCSTYWASGELVFGGYVKNADLKVDWSTTSSSRGYGLKVLWQGEGNYNAFENCRLELLGGELNHSSNWNYGKSRNIGIELFGCAIIGSFEITGTIKNQISLHTQNRTDKIHIYNFVASTNDTYFIEDIANNVLVENGVIYLTGILAANFQDNEIVYNTEFKNVKFVSPTSVAMGWGGVVLVGKKGVQNFKVSGCEIDQLPNYPLVKYMGTQGGVDFSPSGNNIY